MCPTRCKVRNGALTTANYHQVPNEKTPLFPKNTEEKAGFSDERLRWELNPRWRICNPQGTNENTGNTDTPQQIQQQLEFRDYLQQLADVCETLSVRSVAVILEFAREQLRLEGASNRTSPL